MWPQPLLHDDRAARPAGRQVPQLAVPVAVMRRLWLLGHGVQHSPSPAFQNAALAACNLPWTYEIHDVAPESLPAALDALRSGAVLGANVTIPHKRAVADA